MLYTAISIKIATEAVKGLQTSDFRLQTLVPFRASLIANIAFAKLQASISGIYSVKAIQTKVKNGKHDLDCKCRL
jgi:hypothetical protein